MRGRPINRTIRARSDAGRRQSGRRVTAVSIAKFEHVRGPPAIPTVMVSTPLAPWLGAGKSQRPAPRGPASMLAHGARGTWSCISGAPSHARLNCARLAAGEARGAATATGVRAATTCTMEPLMGRRRGRPSQDIYAFDVGDFGKFGLLRHLMPALHGCSSLPCKGAVVRLSARRPASRSAWRTQSRCAWRRYSDGRGWRGTALSAPVSVSF